jgi:hypothetical protein
MSSVSWSREVDISDISEQSELYQNALAPTVMLIFYKLNKGSIWIVNNFSNTQLQKLQKLSTMFF